MSSHEQYDLAFEGLCCNCKLLIFDDKGHGGFESEQSGQDDSYLLFSEDDRYKTFATDYECEDDLPNLPALAESAARGCDCCGGLRNAILNCGLPLTKNSTRVELKMSYVWKDPLSWGNDSRLGEGLVAAWLFVKPTTASLDDESMRAVLTFDAESEPGLCSRWLRLRRSASEQPLSQDNLSWIDTALPHLKEADGEDAGRYLPTRLITFGCADSNGLDARLELTKSLSPVERSTLRYAVLSYCWGPDKDSKRQFRTTKSTLSQRLTTVRIAETSPVIQNAFEVCNALGIKYLWVDAVCIVQDDPVDWEREASQMGEVYGNASITICALASSSCVEPFLRRRQPRILLPFSSNIKNGVTGQIILRYSQSHQRMPSHFTIDPLLVDKGDSNWEQRAWTFQEFHLSQHLLLFGKRRIHVVSGWGSWTEGHEKPEFNVIALPLPYVLQNTFETTGEGLHTFYTDWMNRVEEYSDRQLRYATDRLPAFSGIATAFEPLLEEDDEYVMGLWRKALHLHLLWKAVARQSLSVVDRLAHLSSAAHSQSFVVPSWSWAGQQRHVEFGFPPRFWLQDMSLLECMPEFSSLVYHRFDRSHGPEDRVRGAFLEVTCRILHVGHFSLKRWEESSYNDPFWLLLDDKEEYIADCSLDCFDAETEPEHRTDHNLSLLLIGSYEDSDNGDNGEDEDDESENWQHGEDRYQEEARLDTTPGGRRVMYGLVIGPEPNTSDDSKNYYRVGIFCSKTRQRSTMGSIFDRCELETVRLL